MQNCGFLTHVSHAISTSGGLSGVNPQPVLAQKARRWGSLEMEGGPAPGANNRQRDHSSSEEGACQVAILPQSLAEAQPQEEKAKRRGLGPQPWDLGGTVAY